MKIQSNPRQHRGLESHNCTVLPTPFAALPAAVLCLLLPSHRIYPCPLALWPRSGSEGSIGGFSTSEMKLCGPQLGGGVSGQVGIDRLQRQKVPYLCSSSCYEKVCSCLICVLRVYPVGPLLMFQEPLFAARVVYDLLFYFIVIIIVLNLIFGVIIDTFADLRSEKQKKEEILKTTCFTCGRCYKTGDIGWQKYY